MKEKRFKFIVAILMLTGAIGFNLWLYRLEPTAKVDPNDNAFQFALVDRTNQIWDFAKKSCAPSPLSLLTCFAPLLVDHWVPNWAEGYNLPFYYSHIPQITIVATYRFLEFFSQFQISNFKFQISLFQYYHWIIYLLLCIFPLSVFRALRILKLPWLTAGIGALLSTQISTDGLYGLDPSSFLWRGYGLSSQLFAMVFMPLAIACSYRFLNPTIEDKQLKVRAEDRKLNVEKQNPSSILHPLSSKFFWPSVFFLFATTAGHLGLGIMAFMSIGALALSISLIEILHLHPKKIIVSSFLLHSKRVLLLSGVTVFFLSYWIIPILMYDNYHNISYWDPVWKFDSYGAKEVITRLFNGDIFDFGRLPIFTFLVFTGSFACLMVKKNSETLISRPSDDADFPDIPSFQTTPYAPFAFLFVFWLLMYFGRTTWGGLIDLIPGMKEFHLSRFIVGLHLAGLFLAPIGFSWIAETVSRVMRQVSPFVRLLAYLIIGLLIIPPVYKQTVTYNQLNDTLILQANKDFDTAKNDADKLFQTIRSLPPARVFAGRGGWWGKDFKVAETPYFMHLSTYGIPTVLWLPETWSPNSDTEQYFSESKASDYDLYNMAYVASPPSQKPEFFWKLIQKEASWSLYSVPTSGYFTPGTLVAIVSSDKRSYVNVVHSWIQSSYPEQKLFPQLTFAKNYPKQQGLPNFKMLDEATYKTPDGLVRSLAEEPPVYVGDKPDMILANPKMEGDMIFSTTAAVGENCKQCVVILKQSSHPNWKATVDGKEVNTITVFPFFVAVPLDAPGTHTIVFSYQPMRLKVILLTLSLIVFICVTITKIFGSLKFLRD